MAKEKKGSGAKVAAGVLGLMLAAHAMPGHHHGHGGLFAHLTSSAHSPAAAQAVAFARAQVRAARPYCWGGAGPSCYDCSGLIVKAYGLPYSERTSQEQWAALPHISRHQLRPGDLVFYAGSDGTQSSPGHVVMYIGHGKVIQEFGTGYNAMVTSLDAVNAGPLTGYARA